MKTALDDLAALGGAPLFQGVRPVGQLACGSPDVFFTLLGEMYERRRLTNNGPLVRELERRLEQIHGVEHCIACCSASLGLILLMHELASGRGGEVIIPSFAYPGLPHLVRWAGLRPRFCDVDAKTHTLSPPAVRKLIASDTLMIMGVHQVNSPCLIGELQAIADQAAIPLFFDSVHGIGCTYKSAPIGGFGVAEVFSLHATKLVNGFEGGYVMTDDGALAQALRKGRNFGFDDVGEIAGLGLNAKLNEVHAALALTTLDALEETIAGNKRRYEHYCRCFAGIEGVSILPYNGAERNNYEFVLLEVDDGWELKRDELVAILRGENALARPYLSPATHLGMHCPASQAGIHLPVTEMLSARFVQMPVGSLVSLDDIENLARLFRFLRTHDATIAEALRAGSRARGVR